MDLKPHLTVILPALKGFARTEAALEAWRQQSRIDAIEILILCPDSAGSVELRPNEGLINSSGRHLHELRAKALREARAPYAVIAEDHCFPAHDWAERVVKRLTDGPRPDAGWDVLCPALHPAEPGSVVAASSFLIGYGQWMAPVDVASVEHFPGHNSVIRTKPVLAWGDDLEREILMASFLMRRLAREGARMAMEPCAEMWHFDLPTWRQTMKLFICVGLGFGARRTRDWNWPLRFLFTLAAPLVAARHWWRAATHYRRAGRAANLHRFTLGAAAIWASAWACGEALGSLAGIQRVLPAIAFTEIKPVDKARATLVPPGRQSIP